MPAGHRLGSEYLRLLDQWATDQLIYGTANRPVEAQRDRKRGCVQAGPTRRCVLRSRVLA